MEVTQALEAVATKNDAISWGNLLLLPEPQSQINLFEMSFSYF